MCCASCTAVHIHVDLRHQVQRLLLQAKKAAEQGAARAEKEAQRAAKAAKKAQKEAEREAARKQKEVSLRTHPRLHQQNLLK